MISKANLFSARLKAGQRLITARPFRSPHRCVSDAGLVGGGSTPQTREISLAHKGVLFLDEMPEFNLETLEVLRQPLEEGFVTISRVLRSTTFPADFVLAAAMNPSPCGYRAHSRKSLGSIRVTSSNLWNYRDLAQNLWETGEAGRKQRQSYEA